MGQLSQHGYTLVDSLDQAEICVVNSCTVKNPAESRGLHLAGAAGAAWTVGVVVWRVRKPWEKPWKNQENMGKTMEKT